MSAFRPRTSIVNTVDVYAISAASVFQVGDAAMLRQRCRVLAVQREAANFYGDEGDFNAYPLFAKPIPQPVVYEPLDMNIVNEKSYIRVGCVSILAASTSAAIQIGTNESIRSEARIKHFRQLLGKPGAAAGAGAAQHAPPEETAAPSTD